MLLKDNKKGLVTLIMKKMNGGERDMSPSFGSEYSEEKKTVDGAEQDNDSAYGACCDDMMSALKTGDSSKLKRSLKSFISMVLDEQDVEREEE